MLQQTDSKCRIRQFEQSWRTEYFSRRLAFTFQFLSAAAIQPSGTRLSLFKMNPETKAPLCRVGRSGSWFSLRHLTKLPAVGAYLKYEHIINGIPVTQARESWSHFFFTVNPGHVDIIRQRDMHRGNRNPALCTVQFLVYSDCVWDHFFHVGLTDAALQYHNIHLGVLTSKAESLLAPRTIRWWQKERSSWKMFQQLGVSQFAVTLRF